MFDVLIEFGYILYFVLIFLVEFWLFLIFDEYFLFFVGEDCL